MNRKKAAGYYYGVRTDRLATRAQSRAPEVRR